MAQLNRTHARNAFTLIELLVVVAIIAILIAIALTNFLNARIRAKIARVDSEFRTLALAHGTYRIDNGDYIYDGRNNPKLVHISYWNRVWTKHALYALSTPIAYVSEVPWMDPFAVNASPDARWGRYRQMPYLYWNDVNFSADGRQPNPGQLNWIKNGWFYETDPALGGPVRYIWKLVSQGPNPVAGEAGHIQAAGGWTKYDPTNGLKSGGAIIRYGPE